jgi:addiction module HigA family antidote
MLLAEFLEPMKISQHSLAKEIGVLPQRIHDIVCAKRSVSAEVALRLGRFFSMEARFWLNLQARYDLETTREALAARLERKIRPHAA